MHVHWRKAAAFAEGRLGDYRRADNLHLATAGSASEVPRRQSAHPLLTQRRYQNVRFQRATLANGLELQSKQDALAFRE